MSARGPAQTVLVIMLLSSPFFCFSTWARERRDQWANLQFLAISSSFHSSVADSEDIYLVRLRMIHHQAASMLAILMDDYPPYDRQLAGSLRTRPDEVRLRVQRAPDCDRSFDDLPLRTAPGDPLAILPERLGYEIALSATPAPTTLLPCYRLVRR